MPYTPPKRDLKRPWRRSSPSSSGSTEHTDISQITTVSESAAVSQSLSPDSQSPNGDDDSSSPEHDATKKIESTLREDDMTDKSTNKNKREAIDELNGRRSDLLSMVIKFDALKKDGSNFIQWRRRSARAIYHITGLKGYWDIELPENLSRLDEANDRCALLILDLTIDPGLQHLVMDCYLAHEALNVLQKMFIRSRHSGQFALFQKLMTMEPDLRTTDLLDRTMKIDDIFEELRLTGFQWSRDSVTGMTYLLHLPPEMTNEINRDLDYQFERKPGGFKASEIRSAIQAHITRERMNAETFPINEIASSANAPAVKNSSASTQFAQPPSQAVSLRFSVSGPGPISIATSDGVRQRQNRN